MNFFLGLIVMAGVTYLIRLVPMVLIKKKIENRFIRSFLYYVPYTVLTVMAFPTMFSCTGNYVSGTIAVVICIFLAYISHGMMSVAVGGAISVALYELFVTYILPLL